MTPLPPSAPIDALVGSDLAGRFRVERVLGRGGFGRVYLARHLVLRRLFAVKVLDPDRVTPEIEARFRREARSASRVEHPNVAYVFDFGRTTDGISYLAMEYIEGPTLAELLEQQAGGLPLARGLAILQQIADGLAGAHACRVIHRDIKPRNVIVARGRDGSDLVKILDFGLAKAIGQEAASAAEISSQDQCIGTPEYLAPERFVAGSDDYRCDVYSFGVTAFEVLVGRPPFSGSPMELFEAHVHHAAPLPSACAPEANIPPVVDAVILRCLHKDPAERFQSAIALAGELRAAVAGSPRRRARAGHTQPLEAVGRSSGLAAAPTALAAPDDSESWESGVSDELPTQLDWPDGAVAQASPEPAAGVPASIALEELAFALEDRALASGNLRLLLARKLAAEADEIAAATVVARLQARLVETERGARRQESRLRRALAQLAAGNREGTVEGDELSAELSTRMRQLAQECELALQELDARLQLRRATLKEAVSAVGRATDSLRDQLTQLCTAERLASDPELERLLSGALASTYGGQAGSSS